MKSKALKYETAVEAFQKMSEESRSLPVQPNQSMSELRGTTWYLRNVCGPLARVNRRGEVRMGRIVK